MGLAAGPVAGMAFMPMRIILDLEAFRRESLRNFSVITSACRHGVVAISHAEPSRSMLTARVLLPPVKS